MHITQILQPEYHIWSQSAYILLFWILPPLYLFTNFSRLGVMQIDGVQVAGFEWKKRRKRK